MSEKTTIEIMCGETTGGEYHIFNEGSNFCKCGKRSRIDKPEIYDQTVFVKCRFCGFHFSGEKGKNYEVEDGILAGECPHCSYELNKYIPKIREEAVKDFANYLKSETLDIGVENYRYFIEGFINGRYEEYLSSIGKDK